MLVAIDGALLEVHALNILPLRAEIPAHNYLIILAEGAAVKFLFCHANDNLCCFMAMDNLRDATTA